MAAQPASAAFFGRESIPPELAERAQWVTWRYVERAGKRTKVPYDPQTGKPASSTDPRTWATLAAALEASQRRRHDGIGYVFAPDDPFVGVDLDSCLDAGGIPQPWAQAIIDQLESYTEASPSGSGVHIIVRGELPPGSRRRGQVEMYSAGRFFTFTGLRLEGTPATIAERSGALAQLHAATFADRAAAARPRAAAPLDIDDAAIIRKALEAQNGAKFRALWNGDAAGYGSASEADAALCGLLAFWTGPDAARIDRLFRQSGLMREKWDQRRGGSTYGERTIAEVLRAPREHYEQRRGRGSSSAGEALGNYTSSDIPPAAGPAFNLTEMGNAERLMARYGDKLLYCYNWKRWLVWDGRRWADDEAGQVAKWAKATVRGIYGEAEREEDEQRRKAIAGHAQKSESDKAVRAMISLAQPERPASPADLDSEATAWLLNCRNGTVDLRTGRLMPHDPSRRITKLAPVDYDPAAQCPTFLAFLERIMGGSGELVTFLQRAIGYSLTGDTSEQVLFVPWGAGANGKSTLLEAVAGVMGDYATRTPPETFMVKRGEGVPNDVARLRGARFVAAVESEEGQRLAESLVKQMTGGDMLTARFLHAEFFSFKPALKLWLATNHKPVIRGTDNAIWRRIRLIPFTVTIPESERDKRLAAKLHDEAAGILAWAVRGCLEWQRDGLTTPAAVLEATEEYRGEMDVLGAFLSDCCVIHRKASATAKALYDAYEAWCEETGERNPLSQRAFGMRLSERGYQRERSNGKHIWRGVGLRSSDPSDPSDSKNGIFSHEGEIRGKTLDPGSDRTLATLHQRAGRPCMICKNPLTPRPDGSGYYPCEHCAETR